MYEYEVVALGKSIEKIQAELNAHGDQGWDLINIVNQPDIYYLDKSSGISQKVTRDPLNSGYIAYFKKDKIKKVP